ncbi:MAG: hypothetical protein ABWY20_16525, partial [Mycobacterium sp.]
HLFINAGGVAPARWFAPVVAVLLKAGLEGVIPENFLALEHPSRGPLEPGLLDDAQGANNSLVGSGAP